MGCLFSTTSSEVKKEVVKKENDQMIKLLLLGSGESGKSTLFKQLKLIYKEKELEKELQTYKSSIYSNILTVVSSLSKYCKKERYFL